MKNIEERNKQIADFIDAISVAQDCNVDLESIVLPTTLSYIGGDNGGDCINEQYDQCNKAENKGNCKNYNSACSKSTNRGSCLNTTLGRGDVEGETKPIVP